MHTLERGVMSCIGYREFLAKKTNKKKQREDMVQVRQISGSDISRVYSAHGKVVWRFSKALK